MNKYSIGRCLVTGGTGFIGRQLVSYLTKSGCSVRLLSRSSIPETETIVCDFTKDEIPSNALDSIDSVFHLAGYAHDLREASKVERLYQAVNVDATIQLAELAVQNRVKRFVFVSSVKAGGSAVAGQCMTEEEQGEPEGVYGRTKRDAELKLLEIGCQSGMHVSIVQSSLVYGWGMKGNLGFMLSGIKEGWFPPIPEVNNRRSMIHVDDLVRSLLLVAEDDRANGEIFIATDGETHSSREIYVAMCNVLGKPVPQWRIPKFLLNIAFFMVPYVKYKANKLFGDECYSSVKLESIGFKSYYKLKDMNKTFF